MPSHDAMPVRREDDPSRRRRPVFWNVPALIGSMSGSGGPAGYGLAQQLQLERRRDVVEVLLRRATALDVEGGKR